MKPYFNYVNCGVEILSRWHATLFFGIAALVMAMPPLIFAGNPAPYVKDGELIEMFRSKRAVFERLREMAVEDAARVSFINQSTLGHTTLSENRRAEYKKAFAELGKDVGVGTGSTHVTFQFVGQGSAIERSWMKGLTYFPAARKSKACMFVTSLDTPPKADGTYLVPIEDDWYIVFGQID